jgi:hypothetical protein
MRLSGSCWSIRKRSHGTYRSGGKITNTCQHQRSAASWLKCISASRCHHLLKTFYSGPNGWRDRQEADGTVTLLGYSQKLL